MSFDEGQLPDWQSMQDLDFLERGINSPQLVREDGGWKILRL